MSTAGGAAADPATAPDDGSLAYEIVDVFTAAPFAGNPLAVVLDADGLDAGQLQALAREFHLSETAFPLALPPGESGADYRVRIFTPEVELPFAGHPSVGTAWVLTRLGRVPGGALVQRCAAGDYRVHVGDRVELTGATPSAGDPLAAGALLAAVGLRPEDLAGPAPRQAGTGLAWTFLSVVPDAVARAGADPAALRAVRELAPAGIYVHAVGAPPGSAPLPVHARAFAGDIGVAEDPATGSAALGLGAYLVASELLAGEGTSRYVVRQGVEMGRPSTLYGSVTARDGRAVECRVGGDVVPVARGRIRVP